MRVASSEVVGPEADGTTSGTWAVVVSAFAVIATAAACGILFRGYLALARLPGEVPPLDQVPDTPQTQGPMQWMQFGTWGLALAALLALVGLVAGVRLVRRPDGFNRGVWAIALAACTPVLAVMLLAGMGAT